MSRMHPGWLVALAICLGVGLIAMRSPAAGAEVIQRGGVRVAFEAELAPRALPRSRSVPVSVSMGGKISSADGDPAPQLRQITIAINRFGLIAPGALPSCRIDAIQPATTTAAMEACGRSLVGEGSFSANVLLPEQAPFPSRGKVYAFNGSYHGQRVILAHVYGTQPAPISYTLPLVISKSRGTFGTVLSASLPAVTSEWGYVTGLSLTLGGGGGFLRASCPAPVGLGGASFPLARTTFAFTGGGSIGATLNRACRVRG